jgi:hypothetical protein
MKLKEWGFMRHKPRRAAANRDASGEAAENDRDNAHDTRQDSSATIVPSPPAACEKRGGWQVLPDTQLVEAEPTFMGMLHQAPA